MMIGYCINPNHRKTNCNHLAYVARCLPCKARGMDERSKRENERQDLEAAERDNYESTARH